MSDFGTAVNIYRGDRSSTTPADEARVKRLAKDLVISPGDRISDYADYDLRFGGSRSRDNQEGILIILTEYGMEDEDRLGSSEYLVARDRPLAEQFGEELQSRLGAEFNVNVFGGDW